MTIPRENRSYLEAQAKLYKLKAIQSGRSDLLGFTLYTKNNYQVNWHHRDVCDKLNRFASGEIKKLAIYMPPQTGKSELSSRRLPAFLLGLDPNLKIAICAYAAEHAQSFNRDVQRIIDSAEYKELFPETKLSSKNVATSEGGGSYKRTANIFEVVGYEGFLKTVGIGGPLTGTPVDIGIVDDPFKDHEQAYSSVYRDRAWNWYNSVFKTRLHNDSQELILLTRWHEDDLAGRIMKEEGDEWEVITYPALKEDNDNPDDPREIGEALWPEKHSKERYDKIKSSAPTIFASMYQQRPAAKEGNMIKRSYFFRYNLLPDAINHIYIDTASSEKELKENDPTGIMVYRTDSHRLYIVYYEEAHYSMPELKRRVRELANQHLTPFQSIINIENKHNAKSLEQELKEIPENIDLNVKLENIKGTKRERVKNVESILETQRVGLPMNRPWVEALENSLAAFPNGKTDESVDCLTGSIRTGLKGNKGILEPA